MPDPFGLLIVFCVDSLCFVFAKFVLLVRFVVVFNCMRHCPLGYIYVTSKGTFMHADI